MTYRAVAIAAEGGNRLETRERIEPDEGEILLSLRCCGLCGTDLFKLAGNETAPGTVLGHELVGDVVAVGAGVTKFSSGDRVVVPHHVACGECAFCLRDSETMCATFKQNLLLPGGFSELILVRKRAVELAARRIPPHVTDDAASFMEPGACVLRGIRRSGILVRRRGDRHPRHAVILGGGSMGLLHLLVLRAIDPDCRVVVSDIREDRCALALTHGAVGASHPDRLDAAVAEVTGGAGVDAVFDTVGGAARLDTGIALLRDGGSIVLFAHAARNESARFDLNALFKAEKRVVATYSGSLAEQEEVFRLIECGALDPSPLVTNHLPLTRFDDAVALARRQEAVKVMVTKDGER